MHDLIKIDDKGFTLAELIIVSLIIGVITILSAPFLTNLRPHLQLRSAAHRLAWELMAARVQAISKAQDVMVNFHGAQQYEIGPDLNENGVLDDNEKQVIDIKGSASSVTIFASNNLTFSPSGLSNNAVSISLSNASQTRSISVAFTGIVRLNK